MHALKMLRWLPLVMVVAVVVGVGWGLGRSADRPAEAAPAAPAVRAAKAPITDPVLQRWLWLSDKAQVELNNALVPLEAGQATEATCTRLAKAVKAFARLGRAPQAEVDSLIRVGQDKFQEAASVCLTGDKTAAYTLAKQGLTERGHAYNQLDDVLEGD